MTHSRRTRPVAAAIGLMALFAAALGRPAWALGTLSCTVASSCSGGVVVFRMYSTSNSHSELASQSNYGQLVCCSGVPGLSDSCSGVHAVVANLSGTTNAHAEEGTLSNYAHPVCLSVPSGGAISVAYQSGSCSGYDTTIASLSATTNAHAGDAGAYALKVCGHGLNGTLTTDIVDGSGASVSSPSVSMAAAQVGFQCAANTGTFGTSSQKVRVDNGTPSPAWTLSLAATGGTTSLWTAGADNYDFNDAGGCSDGADADSYAGRLTVDPSASTVTPRSGCANTGISKGSSAGYAEGSVDAVTLMTASSSADTGCYWDMTGIGLSQSIPAEQIEGTYALDMTLTITAN